MIQSANQLSTKALKYTFQAFKPLKAKPLSAFPWKDLMGQTHQLLRPEKGFFEAKKENMSIANIQNETAAHTDCLKIRHKSEL